MITDKLPQQSDSSLNEYPSEAVTTAAAQQVWKYVYHEPWPEGWTVRWVHLLDPLEFTPLPRAVAAFDEQRIELSWYALNLDAIRNDDEPFDSLVHEFTHLRHPRLLHGRTFDWLCFSTYVRSFKPGSVRLVERREEKRAELARLRWGIRTLEVALRRLGAQLRVLESRAATDSRTPPNP
jgi:hypothetical protein